MLWKPTAEYSNNSMMNKFVETVASKYELPGNDYFTVHRWSVENTSRFWGEVWDFCNIKYSTNYNRVVDDPKKMPGAKWFEQNK